MGGCVLTVEYCGIIFKSGFGSVGDALASTGFKKREWSLLKRISLEQLFKGRSAASYEEQHRFTMALLAEGRVKPLQVAGRSVLKHGPSR